MSNIKRMGAANDFPQAVIFNNVAYFSGVTDDARHQTLSQQGAAIFKKYAELLSEYGLQRENVIFSNMYFYLPDYAAIDSPEYKIEFGKQLEQFTEFFKNHMPAGNMCYAHSSDAKCFLEIALTVAIPSEE